MGLTPQIFTLLAVALIAANASELVPVYMWQTIPTKGLFPAVTHVSQDTFKEILLQKQAHQHSDRMIIFAEQNLSPEDFSAKTFYELRELSDHTRVTYLPTVESPMEVIQSFGPQVPSVSVEDIIKNPKLLEKRQLIIDLNDARDDENRVDMLKRHSKFIAEVCEKMSASSGDNVLAVYTGRHSSWIVPSDIVKHRHTRAAADPGVVTTLDNFIVFINGSFYFSDPDGIPSQWNITGAPTQKHSAKDRAGTLTIATTDKPVVFNYVMDPFGYWIVTNITVDKYMYLTEIHTPLGFSYSCSSNLTLREHPKDDPADFKPTYLSFPTFQFQFFNNGTKDLPKTFYDSYDCVGFTSPAIWSGLFVTFILAIIISLGVTMIMDIKTMDRFDDPKGKTIIINATE